VRQGRRAAAAAAGAEFTVSVTGIKDRQTEAGRASSTEFTVFYFVFGCWVCWDAEGSVLMTGRWSVAHSSKAALESSFSGLTVPLIPHSQLSSKAALERSFSGQLQKLLIHNFPARLRWNAVFQD
jgi:hypothetical protein